MGCRGNVREAYALIKWLHRVTIRLMSVSRLLLGVREAMDSQLRDSFPDQPSSSASTSSEQSLSVSDAASPFSKEFKLYLKAKMT